MATSGYRLVTPAEVETMLRQADAPEPWRVNRPISDVADIINFFAYRLQRPTAMSETESLQHRAQKAIDELERLLPKLIAQHEGLLTGLSLPNSISNRLLIREPEHEEQNRIFLTAVVAEQRRMLEALRPVSWPGRMRRWKKEEQRRNPDRPPGWKVVRASPSTAAWHWAARAMFDEYAGIVGKAHTTRSGPAARFVAAAVNRMGYTGSKGRPITAAAVEGALNRQGGTHEASADQNG